MIIGGHKRTRSERVAALALPPGQWERTWASLRRRDVLARIGLALLATVIMAVVIRAWSPPFAYRVGDMPSRDITARVSFDKVDVGATELARERAKNQVRCVYVHDPGSLRQLRDRLRPEVVEPVLAAETLQELDPRLWSRLQPPRPKGEPPPTPEQQQAQFEAFRAALKPPENLDRFEQGVAAAFAPFEERGLLARLPENHRGNANEILVHPPGEPEPLRMVKLSDVLVEDGAALRESLRRHLDRPEVAERVFAWIEPQLPAASTLSLDEEATRRDREQAAAVVEPVLVHYRAGDTLVEGERLEGQGNPGGTPARSLTEKEVDLLRAEFEAVLAKRPVGHKLVRFASLVVMLFAIFVLCGIYMRYRQRGPLASLTRLSVLLALSVIAVAAGRWASVDPWRAEILPLMLFGMTMAIVHRQELALLLSAVLAFILVLALGHSLHGFFLLIGVTTAANLNLGRIRTRVTLIYVGLFAGAVAVLLDIGLGMIESRPFGWEMLGGAARSGLWAVAAGFLMTGLLPFVERLFGVLTDLSLLELGDMSHPLLQELIRRAPSTYNHSVTVGSIAEAAADAIGARGLLVRVGAYFHDIGKMLKPGYFIENQGAEANRHETLVPAMSTLVIIAHIKDGADLARKHRLPQPIIDLIEQHHGTTLVGYFYERAAEQKQADPNGGDVDESTFRYPGPKPQTKEAAVLMLADNVESASRTLVDPTPARIERLVREVAERRLHGGQFDDSGLTLRELRTIERSMTMSLISIYHGRIKYPEQRTA